MDRLSNLSKLLKGHNSTGKKISEYIGDKPMNTGNIGEFIASQIFNIQLHEDRSHKGSDGYFLSGPLENKTVNIKWYTGRENIISLKTGDDKPEYYLVMTGPKKRDVDKSRPLIICSVFLFETGKLEDRLEKNGVTIRRNATSVKNELWVEAEIYPANTNTTLPLDADQKRALSMFSGFKIL